MTFVYQVIVPSLWDKKKLSRLLFSFSIQKNKPELIWIILDKKITFSEKQEYLYFFKSKFVDLNIQLVSNVDFNFIPNKGVSYVRNYWLNLAINFFSEGYLLFVDDDISFSFDLMQKIFDKYKNNKEFIVFPKVYFKHTNILQTAGIEKFSPWTGKIKFIKPKSSSWIINMTSLQFLFWPIKIFSKFNFDVRMKFVYEDLDYTMNITKNGYEILGFDDLQIRHFENKKDKSQRSYVSNPFLAYEKWKNRILFVKKHFNLKDKLIYFSIGIWIHSLYLILLMIFYNEDKLWSIIGFLKWTWEGFRLKV